MTVKDQFNLSGVDTTIGYVGRSFSPATEDAVIVRLLKEMGAVVLLKTNLPQTLMVRLFQGYQEPRCTNILSDRCSGPKRTILSGAG